MQHTTGQHSQSPHQLIQSTEPMYMHTAAGCATCHLWQDLSKPAVATCLYNYILACAIAAM